MVLLTVLLEVCMNWKIKYSTLVLEGNILTFRGSRYEVDIGKNGIQVDKKEGDRATPMGTFKLSKIYYNPQRTYLDNSKLGLPVIKVSSDDGWCDDPNDMLNYNKLVKLPYDQSHERLIREDELYDVFILIDYNTGPIIAGLGSCIFMHCKGQKGYTQGCISVNKSILLNDIIPYLNESTVIKIKKSKY